MSSRRPTIRGTADGVAVRMEGIGLCAGRSIESTFRLHRLQRYVTWNDEESVAFNEALASQRRVEVDNRRC